MFCTSEYLRPQEPNKSSILIYGMSQVVSFHPYAPLWDHVTWNQALQSSEAWSGKRHGQARARHLSAKWLMKYSWGPYNMIFVLCFKKEKKKDGDIPIIWLRTEIYLHCQMFWSLMANSSWRTLNDNCFYLELHCGCIEGSEERTVIFIDQEPGICIYHVDSKALEDYCGGQTDTWITGGWVCFVFF